MESIDDEPSCLTCMKFSYSSLSDLSPTSDQSLRRSRSAIASFEALKKRLPPPPFWSVLAEMEVGVKCPSVKRPMTS